MDTVVCRCCGQNITVEFQERRAPKAPILLLTCRNKACKLRDVTIAVYAVDDYYSRDIADKYTINK
jgi:hypothetical protein